MHMWVGLCAVRRPHLCGAVQLLGDSSLFNPIFLSFYLWERFKKKQQLLPSVERGTVTCILLPHVVFELISFWAVPPFL